MAKKRLKLNPAGLLFLIAIAVLIIALIAVIAVLSSTCKGERETSRLNTAASASPDTSAEATDQPSAPPSAPVDTEPPASDDPTQPSAPAETPAPVDPATTDSSGLPPITTDNPGGGVVVNTPPATQAPASPSSEEIYTSPTSAQKKNAKDGYVAKDKVNMRKGPGTKYDVVKEKIAKNTSVTLYELQDGWWFLKCGSSYGYIRKDMIKEGKAPEAAKDSDDKTFEGTIKTGSTAALRKSADSSSNCIKEFSNDTKVTVYYKTKGKDGKMWYYLMVNETKQKGYIRSDLVKTSSKVPTK